MIKFKVNNIATGTSNIQIYRLSGLLYYTGNN